MEKREQYQKLAEVFKYPNHDTYKQNVSDCFEMLKEHYPAAAVPFERFAKFVEANDMFRIEEVFGLTFHIQAICYLDLGYVLFGEDYKRGDFLVHMKKEQEKIGHDCGVELPDNLAMILELMYLSKDDLFIDELGKRIMIPAVEKMEQEFDAARLELRAKLHKKKEKVFIEKDAELGNVYSGPINALSIVLKADFENVSFENDTFKPEYGRDFLTNCGTCSEEHEPVVAKKSN